MGPAGTGLHDRYLQVILPFRQIHWQEHRAVVDDVPREPGADVGVGREEFSALGVFQSDGQRPLPVSWSHALVLPPGAEGQLTMRPDLGRVAELAQHEPVAHPLEPLVYQRPPFSRDGAALGVEGADMPLQRLIEDVLHHLGIVALFLLPAPERAADLVGNRGSSPSL
jgi:hypothetical protein